MRVLLVEPSVGLRHIFSEEAPASVSTWDTFLH